MNREKIYDKTCVFFIKKGKCQALCGDKATCLGCAFYKTKVQYAAELARTAVRLKALESVR